MSTDFRGKIAVGPSRGLEAASGTGMAQGAPAASADVLDEGETSGGSIRGTAAAHSDVVHSNVYVKNLADHIDDAVLCQLFGRFGAIKTACVMLDPVTKRSRNFGFVKFESRDAAHSAVEQLHNAEVEGRKLLVKFADSDAEHKSNVEATPSDNIYVKGLPPTMSEEALHSLFSTYGNVTQLKIISRPATGSTGEALVRMADMEQAAWAIKNLQARMPDGASVRYADTPGDKLERRRNQGRRMHRFPYGQAPVSLPNGVYSASMMAGMGHLMPGIAPPIDFAPSFHPAPWSVSCGRALAPAPC